MSKHFNLSLGKSQTGDGMGLGGLLGLEEDGEQEQVLGRVGFGARSHKQGRTHSGLICVTDTCWALVLGAGTERSPSHGIIPGGAWASQRDRQVNTTL